MISKSEDTDFNGTADVVQPESEIGDCDKGKEKEFLCLFLIKSTQTSISLPLPRASQA